MRVALGSSSIAKRLTLRGKRLFWRNVRRARKSRKQRTPECRRSRLPLLLSVFKRLNVCKFEGWTDRGRKSADRERSSKMGRNPIHPAVFVRVANKGDKSSQRAGIEIRPEWTLAPLPYVFVNVASKGVAGENFVNVASKGVISPLSATLRRGLASVASKRVMGAGCLQEGNWDGPEGFEEVRRTAGRVGMVRRARKDRADLTTPI